MTSVREILTTWTLPSGGSHKSVMYFDTVPAIAVQRAALNTFWNSIRVLQSTGTVYRIDEVGRELDTATGVLTGAWAEGTVYNQAGSSGSVPVPDAAMMLIQWRTGNITNGRFVRGRTFVPGLGIGQTTGGNVIPSAITTANAAATALIGSAAKLYVWHRPVAGSGGGNVLVTQATIWSEFAVLRRRRG